MMDGFIFTQPLAVVVAAGGGQALLEILARMVRIVRDLLSLYG